MAAVAQSTTGELAETANAANRVFQVAELLEAIVLYLPIRTVIATRRVDRTFRSTIEGSNKIQQKALLLPSSTRTYWDVTFPEKTWMDTPTVALSNSNREPIRASWPGPQEYYTQHYFSSYTLQILQPNDVFFQRTGEGGDGNIMEVQMEVNEYDDQMYQPRRKDNHIGRMRWTPLFKPSDIPLHSIWSRMYITQPPCEGATVRWWCHQASEEHGNWRKFDIENEAGLRMEDLVVDWKKELWNREAHTLLDFEMFVIPDFGIFFRQKRRYRWLKKRQGALSRVRRTWTIDKTEKALERRFDPKYQGDSRGTTEAKLLKMGDRS